MTELIRWSGDGLSGNLTTSSAGPGDTAPSFITGAIPTIEPVAIRSPAIRFAQLDTTVNYAVWTFSGVDLSSYAIRKYHIFAGFVAAGQAAVIEVVNAADTLLSWGIALTSNGRLTIIDKNGATQATGAVSLAPGVRYRIEAVVNNTQYDVYAYEGESLEIYDHLSTALVGPVPGGKMRWGNAFGAPQAPPFYGDDLVITDTPILIGPVDAPVTTGVVPCDSWDPIWCCDLTAASIPVSGNMLRAATEALWALSGRQFGLCTVTLRPCRRECPGDAWGGWSNWWEWGRWPQPLFFRGVWSNLTCGACTNGCSCTMLSEAVLPGPVHDIVNVKLDGASMAASGYRLDDGRLLVRTDGGVWPICQDLDKTDTQVGTWSVTANFGLEVPTLGRLAVGELACELIKACIGDDSCLLPQPVQQITRQGVSITFLDPNEVFASGRIGLYQSDLFIQTYNPYGLKARSRVYDVDGPSFRRAGT